MRQRQGSRGQLVHYRSVEGTFKVEQTLEPSFSKRSLEEYPPTSPKPSPSPLKPALTPDPKLPSSHALKQILFVKPQDKSRLDSDSAGSDLLSDPYWKDWKDLTPSSNASRHDQILYSAKPHNQQIQRLRQQNEALKREFWEVSRELRELQGVRGMYDRLLSEKQQLERVRERMARRVADLEKKCEMHQQENNLYGDIVGQLKKRVNVLLQQNKKLEESVQMSMEKLQEFDLLQERLDRLRLQYKELERVVQQDSDEWEIAKDLWINQKEYYKEIIRKLQFQLSKGT